MPNDTTPSIETERLLLRPLGLPDLGTMHELYGDPDAMRWAGGPSADVDESAERLGRLIDHQAENGFSLWAVVERDSGAVIGDAGLILLALEGPEVEVGYRLKVPYWGKGYATEAARAWVAHGFDELGLDRILGVTHPANVASQHVLEKVGLRYQGMSTYRGNDARFYAIERNGRR